MNDDDDDEFMIRKKSNTMNPMIIPEKESINISENVHRSTRTKEEEEIKEKEESKKINTNLENNNDSNNNKKIIEEEGDLSSSIDETKEIEILFLDPELTDNLNEKHIIYNDSYFQRLMSKMGINTITKIIISLSIVNIYVSSLNLSQKMAYTSIFIYPALIIIVGIFSHWTIYIISKLSDKYKKYSYDGIIKRVLFKQVMPFYIFFVILNNLGNIILEEIILYKLIIDITIKFDESKNEFFSKINIKYFFLYGIAYFILFPIFQFTNILFFRGFIIIEIIIIIIFILILIGNYILLFISKFNIDNIKNKLAINIDYFLYPNNEFYNSIIVLFYSFNYHDSFFQLFEKFRNPSSKRINKIVRSTIIIDIILCLILAFLGFFSLPFEEIKDLIIFRNKIEKEYIINDWLMIVGRVIYFICILLKLLKDYYRIRNIILINICKYNIKKIGKCINFITSFFILLSTTFAAVYFQNVSDCICLIGGFCSIYISFIIPLILFIKGNDYSFCHLKNIFVLILIIILFFISTSSLYFTIRKIINTYKND